MTVSKLSCLLCHHQFQVYRKKNYVTKTKEYREKQINKQANIFALFSYLRIPEPYLLLKNPDTSFLFGEARFLIIRPRNCLSIPNTSSLQLLSHVQLFVTPRTVAHQAPLSIHQLP